MIVKMRLKIEEPLKGTIFGNLIDVEVVSDEHELEVFEIAKNYMREYKIERDEKEVNKRLDEMIKELRKGKKHEFILRSQ